MGSFNTVLIIAKHGLEILMHKLCLSAQLFTHSRDWVAKERSGMWKEAKMKESCTFEKNHQVISESNNKKLLQFTVLGIKSLITKFGTVLV